MASDPEKTEIAFKTTESEGSDLQDLAPLDPAPKKSLARRFRELLWDSWDVSPEERKFISKIDFFIL